MKNEIPYTRGFKSALFPDNPPLGAKNRKEYASQFDKKFDDLSESQKDFYRKEFARGYEEGETVRKSHKLRRIDSRLAELNNQLAWFRANGKTDDPEFERLDKIKLNLELKMKNLV